MLGKWSPLMAGVLAIVLLFLVGTLLVGIELYSMTGHQFQFNTQ